MAQKEQYWTRSMEEFIREFVPCCQQSLTDILGVPSNFSLISTVSTLHEKYSSLHTCTNYSIYYSQCSPPQTFADECSPTT